MIVVELERRMERFGINSNLITNELRAALRDVRTKWQPKKRTARARG